MSTFVLFNVVANVIRPPGLASLHHTAFLATFASQLLQTTAFESPEVQLLDIFRRTKVTPRSNIVKKFAPVAASESRVRLNKYLDKIAIPRSVGSRNHWAVGEFIREILENLHYKVDVDVFSVKTVTAYGVVTFRNIIATANPIAPRRLVLACHYDSKIMNFDFVGAVDSAAPCAILLDIAHSLSHDLVNHHENVTLQLIFFDGEEAIENWSNYDSLYGANYLAYQLQKTPFPYPINTHNTNELHRMDSLVLLDLLGNLGSVVPNYLGTNFFPIYNSIARTEQVLFENQSISGQRTFLGETWAKIEDDHVPFLQRGVRVAHLIPTPFPWVWHNQYDTRINLDMNTIENLAKILKIFVASYLNLKVA